MLVSFGARNYLSFKEGFEISMQLPSLAASEQAMSTAMCIVGANASGKSNVIRALTYVSQFCCHSFDNKPEDSLNIVPYRFGPELTSFFLEFDINDVRYYYDAQCTKKEVVRERLARKVERRVAVFHREGDELVECIKEFSALEKIKLRKNVSVVSMAHQYEVAELEDVYAFFAGIVSNINPFYGEISHTGRAESIFAVSRQYKDLVEDLAFIQRKLREAGTGVDDITIERYEQPTKYELYIPVFVHNTKQGPISVPFNFESSGTRHLYAQLSLFKRVLDQGGVLLLDEFDNNLHPDLLGWLLDLFLDPENNPKGGQLIFSSHNTSLMDMLTKYQIVAVNKEENESSLYRLDELPGNIIRNDRSVEAVYKSGKIGGTPSIEARGTTGRRRPVPGQSPQ